MAPRWGQNPPRRLPEALRRRKKRQKKQDGIKDTLISMFLNLLDPILEGQGRPREAQDPAKRGPRGAQRGPKVGSKRDLIFALFFQCFFDDFLLVFLVFFGTILSIFLRQYCYPGFMKILIFICVFAVEIDLPLFI